jgi:predicted aldo/keto reductase-like oxidoreductase
MTDLFLEKGFTYFDTAYGYYNGLSEMAAKTALVTATPESFQLATKLPAWAVKTEDEAKAMLDTSLERTGAGYFDFISFTIWASGGLKFSRISDSGNSSLRKRKKG